MMGKLLCFLGIHDYVHSELLEPNRNAKIVTKVVYGHSCKRCPKTYEQIFTFDPITGKPT